MSLPYELEKYREDIQHLKEVPTLGECSSFADLCWDEADPLTLDPGIKFETMERIVVLQRIKGQLRYFAGGWGKQENVDKVPNGFGVFLNIRI